MYSFHVKKGCFVFLLLVTLIVAPALTRSETAGTEAGASLPLSSFAIDKEIGKVQERFKGSSGRMIIQIQDVHAHAIAQQNIAAILERLRTVFGVEKAALEGAWSSTALPKSHSIPTSREKQLLATTLLEDDRISGPIYAAIMSPEAITLAGIEDEALYEKNRGIYLSHLGKMQEIEEKLKAYGSSLEAAQRSAWGPDLLTFGNAFGKFRETSDLGKFFPVLLKTAEVQKADISDLAQITLIRDVMALEKSFVKERLEKEVKQVIKKYKNRPWTLEELIRGGKIPPEEVGLYPEIKKMTVLYKMRDEISLQDLTDQIGNLTGRILERLIKTPKEGALWERTERFYLSKRLLLLQATPTDLKAYEDERSLLESELASADLWEALALSAEFYDTVKKRDEVFFDKIMTDPALAGDIAIVTGGFHTDGLSQKFRDAGVSYITVAPELGGTAMNAKLYNERMEEEGLAHFPKEKAPAPFASKGGPAPFPENEKGASPNSNQFSQGEDWGSPDYHHGEKDQSQGRPQSSTLSELRNALATTDEYFPPAFEVLQQTKDIRKAKVRFAGNIVAISKTDKVRNLAAKGLLRRSGGPRIDFQEFREKEFVEKKRPEQLSQVRSWIDQAEKLEQKAMAVIAQSGILKIQGQLIRSSRPGLLEQTLANGDIFAVIQDTETIPEVLLGKRTVRYFPVKTVAELLSVKKFQALSKPLPDFVVIQDRYRGDFVALPEEPASLLLYRIIALNPGLYRAALNPSFLILLQGLVSEILSQEVTRQSV